MSILFLLCVLCFTSTVAIELPDIPIISRSEVNEWNVDTTLSLEQATVTIGSFNFKTRLYESSIPGPTLRLKRGDKVRVKMVNNLDETKCGFTSGAIVSNGEMITNLHTHGLHVSSEEPQDNVHVQIRPGKYYTYEYQIPADHLGGTHWYHPHHHGSTSAHVGGGASGVIIIEDDPSDNIPSQYTNMPEKIVMMTAIDTDVAQLEAAGGGTWVTSAPNSALLLANGVTSPTITINAGSGIDWMRLRMIFSASGHSLAIKVPSACVAMLLAKDGVYLPYGARQVSVLKFAAGNRADIALSCSIGLHTFSSSPSDASSGGGGGGGGGGIGGPMTPFPELTVFEVDWKESGGGNAATALPKLTYSAPAYLTDLTSVEPDEIFTQGVQVGGGEVPGACEFLCGPYEHATVLQYMSVDKVQEFRVTADAHPLHIHINHMQLVTVENNGWDGWHEKGDFVDTFLGEGTVRFTTDTFKGEVIMHCHLLTHEDLGCMTQMVIVDDKSQQDWGYCLHGDAIPSVAAICMSTISAFLTFILVLAYSGKFHEKFGYSHDIILFMEKENFGLFAIGSSIILFVCSIIPLVNDDGYNSGSIVATLHANENSYVTFLPLYVIDMLIALFSTAWLSYTKWYKEYKNIYIANSTTNPKVGATDVDAKTAAEMTELVKEAAPTATL